MVLTRESAALAKRRMDEASSLINRLLHRLEEGVGSRAEAEAIRQKIVSLGGTVPPELMLTATHVAKPNSASGSRISQTSQEVAGYHPSESKPSSAPKSQVKAPASTWSDVTATRLAALQKQDEETQKAQAAKERELRAAQRRDIAAREAQRRMEEQIERLEPAFAMGNTAWDKLGEHDRAIAMEQRDIEAKRRMAAEQKHAAQEARTKRLEQRKDAKRSSAYEGDCLPHDRIDPTTGKVMHTALPDKYLSRAYGESKVVAPEPPNRTEALQNAMFGLVGTTTQCTQGQTCDGKTMSKVQAYKERSLTGKQELKANREAMDAIAARNAAQFAKRNSAQGVAEHNERVCRIHQGLEDEERDIRKKREGGMDLPTADQVAHSKGVAYLTTAPVDFEPDAPVIPYNARGASYIDQIADGDEERRRRERLAVAPMTDLERQKIRRQEFYKRNPHRRPISPTTQAVIEDHKRYMEEQANSAKRKPNGVDHGRPSATEDEDRLNDEEFKINAVPSFVKPLV
ncbi:hypothetical protein GMRT_12678 [Giardia muris]|uniref:Uncharacterized protein n=1 Tax=Giardia muris TaxID=5742 RepID=A0A4Z1SQB7_GIAMU|nr:hypothetical protein GMRT_12678 [Giardia muris]|eukprot:TNJ27870.1 hypothetical protein GMRT_12678 [Giardia muris]